MGIRIDSIARHEHGAHFAWYLRGKGYDGLGIHFSCWTGVDGHGLFVRADGDRAAEELLASEMFHIDDTCTAEQVVEHVATALISMGWGPEYIDDPASISGGRPIRSQVVQAASKSDLVRHPL